MNNIFKGITALLLVTFFVASCDYLDPEINIDPNNPTDVSMDLLLPAAQANFAYTMGGDIGRYTSCWTQHHSGVERQHSAIEVYNIKESDSDNTWNTMYADVMKELDTLSTKADETSSPHYKGLSQVITAMAVGTMVDLFNDIPFSEALVGAENLTPAYDNAATLYANIQTMLDDAIVNLSAAESNFSPGADDLMLGGDLAAWIAAANTLKARYTLRLTGVDGAAAASTRALTHIDAGSIASNAGDAQVDFVEGQKNPLYAFNDERGDIRMGKFFVDWMVAKGDPRIAGFAADGAASTGSAAGVFEIGASMPGTFYASQASPVMFVSYVESKFIEAEAAFRTGDMGRAATAHNEAVMASLAKVGVSDATFEANEAAEDMSTITLEKIMEHKYIAMYTQLEAFSDWRRTGIPALSPAAGQNQIARRMIYPGDERRYNVNNMPAGVTQYDRVFLGPVI